MQDAGENQKPETDKYYIRPKAANDRMKLAQNMGQTVYISGATGFGKTSFVADYLFRRRYEYYSMAESVPEDILRGLSCEKNRIVVVDDLQRLTETVERETARETVEKLVKDPEVWLVLVGRCPVPAWLKPVYIQHVFVMIGEKELALSEREEKDYLKMWDLELTDRAEKRLRTLSCGHPLFLRIEALRLKQMETEPDSTENRIRMEMSVIEQARSDWWDYLEVRVYSQWDVQLQEFLMDISIVEQFDLSMARMITRKTDADRLIRLAQETGSILYCHGSGERESYELRTPVRLSMRRMIRKKYSYRHIDSLYYNAACSYELQEKILEALEMYEKCHNEEGISRLLIENARKYAGNGYYWELRRYYLGLSEHMIRQSPELMAGMSLLQSILLNDEESEKWYRILCEYEKSQTGSAKKEARARLFYLDIALPQRGAGGMADMLKKAWMFIKERKTTIPELSLTNNQPSMMDGGKDFCEWSKRDRELAGSIGKIVELLLGRFGKGLINLALAESFFEKGADNYEVSELAQRGRMQAQAGGKQEQVFVGTGILAWLSAFSNHMDNALESLESFRGSVMDMPQLLTGIDTLRTRFYLYAGRSSEVDAWMKQAPDEEAEFCTLERYRYITKVRVYLSKGKRENALRLLMQMQIYAKHRERIFLQMEVKILLAITQFRMGEEKWRETLQQSITLAEEYHLVRVLSREGAALWELLKKGGFVWQDPEFQKQVCRECEQMARIYPAYLSEKQEGNVLLTDKALMVLRLQAEGLSVEEIAKRMHLSKSGIKYYNQETYKKLGVNGKAAAITEARNRKLI